MKRVMVIGSCGAGKSTFARVLHEITGLPLLPLDRYYWKPGWVEPRKQEWSDTVERLVSEDSWIIDGNFGGTMEMRLKRADTVIWLDLPRYLCTFRVLKRNLIAGKSGRPDMADGCDEKLDPEFIKYVWNFRSVKNPLIKTRIRDYFEGSNYFRFQKRIQISGFLEEIRSGKTKRHSE